MIISAAYAAEQAAHAAGHGSLLQDPTFWVGLAFCLTVAVLAKPVGRMLGDALQSRADGIASKLEEAKKLREEARALLLDYQQKQQDSRKEAEALLQKAQDNAEKIKIETQNEFEAKLQKREEMALARLKLAEEKATEEVRDLAVNIALTTVEKILSENLSGEEGRRLIEKQIDDLPNLLSGDAL